MEKNVELLLLLLQIDDIESCNSSKRRKEKNEKNWQTNAGKRKMMVIMMLEKNVKSVENQFAAGVV